MQEGQVLHLSFEVIGALLALIGSMMAYYLSRLTKSVEQLNLAMPVVMTKVESHERRIEKLEERYE